VSIALKEVDLRIVEDVMPETAEQKLEGAEDILGSSPYISRVREFIARVAGTNTTVLITGETGTGKELVARAIHRNSLRAKRPFIAINCAAVTETLLESELFGHERGAFTGADKSRFGIFEAAHGGTLFLDEVAEMSPAAQAKLLRVLADGEIQRVGSTISRHVDVRVLAATHRELEDWVREGLFREDLYYRLAVVPVHLAPLRERAEDISEMSRALSLRIAAEIKVPARPVSSAALEKLRRYSFPGNVRELQNLLERALILGQGSELQPEDFQLQSSPAAGPQPAKELTAEVLATRLPKHLTLRQIMTQVERALIARSLDLNNGVKAEAARNLGLSRSDFAYRINKYGMLATQEENTAGGAV